jgi:hypothetical protein
MNFGQGENTLPTLSETSGVVCDPASVLVGVGLQILCVYNLVLTVLGQGIESLGPSVCIAQKVT